MHSIVPTLSAAAKELNTTPQAIVASVVLDGKPVNKGNWYNWKDNRAKPSAHMQRAVEATIARLREKTMAQKDVQKPTHDEFIASVDSSILILEKRRSTIDGAIASLQEAKAILQKNA